MLRFSGTLLVSNEKDEIIMNFFNYPGFSPAPAIYSYHGGHLIKRNADL